MPFIGGIAVQELKGEDVEGWHGTLRSSGRKDGKGGLSALNVRHAHRLLSQARGEAARRAGMRRLRGRANSRTSSMSLPSPSASRCFELLPAILAQRLDHDGRQDDVALAGFGLGQLEAEAALGLFERRLHCDDQLRYSMTRLPFGSRPTSNLSSNDRTPRCRM